MTSVSEVLSQLRFYVHRGVYSELTNYADELPPTFKQTPLVSLELSRAFLRQGRPMNAEAVLTSANLATATPGEQLILTLEKASLSIYRQMAIQSALQAAQAAFAAAETQSIDPAERAEADRVHIRILLTAATYFEISPEQGQQARDRLPAIARILQQAGRIDEALAAQFTYAERLDDTNARINALAQVASPAIASHRPDLAGEAHCVRAEQMLSAGAPSDEILETLAQAKALYTEANHTYGWIDVQKIQARLDIDRNLASPEALEACLTAYQQVEFPRGMLNVLMDLSQLAHDQGDTAKAIRYRQQMIGLAEAMGMGLARDSFQTAQVDLLMRNADYGGAIELCQAAIATHPPAMSQAGYEQLLASAYSFIDNLEAACTHGRQAIVMYESIGAIDSASDAVMKLTSDLSSFSQEAAWQEAKQLLEAWIAKDEARADWEAAVNKREMQAQIHIQQFFYSPENQGQLPLLDLAEGVIQATEVLTQHLPPRQAQRRLANLHQLRGQIYQGRGDEDSVIQTWQSALQLYEAAGQAMEVANCHYILGAIHLNRANQQLMPNFGTAESHFREALIYYDSAGMREKAADTRFMFARLYTNASVQVAQELGNQMLDAAIDHLADGESDYDAIRREFTAGHSVLDVQGGKRALIAKSQRIYELALEILCLFRPDPISAWKWAQRAKARALSDVLGTGAVPPARILGELAHYPDSLQLIQQERELVARLNHVSPGVRLELRGELNGLWQRMMQDAHLGDYLELRLGLAIDANDLAALLTPAEQTESACLCMDWVAVGDRLFLLALRPGQPAYLERLPLRLSTVQTFVQDNLSRANFRSNLRDTPEVLHDMAPLIAPLAALSHPEDLLILCPTGPLHALPLHALEIDGEPLLARNPVVYCSSLNVLRHCLARRRQYEGLPTAAVFGDPNGDRAEATQLVAYLEQRLHTKPLVNQAVTRQAFTAAIAGQDFIHFQGHAVHEPRDPLASYLALADTRLTAREVFALPELQADLVALAACESAANVIATGDEPLGLIPAFLYAGTNTVLATLWKVQQKAAALTMQLFYDRLLDSQNSVHKAEALRQAMLAVRATPGFESPYYWAPFVLNGDWF